MLITCCGVPVANDKMAQLRGRKSFSMIIRSEQGKRLADHLVELEIITYLNRKTVQLANGVGVRSQEIADYLGISNGAVVKHLKDSELALHKIRRRGSKETIWVYRGVTGIIQQPPTVTKLLKEFFSRPEVIVKLENGEGVTSKFVAASLDVDLQRIVHQIGVLKDEFDIERAIPPYAKGDTIWTRTGVEPTAVRKDIETIRTTFAQLFNRPDIAQRLASGTGLTSREIKDNLSLNKSTRAISKYLLELKDELSIKPIKIAKSWLWIHKNANYVAHATIPSLRKTFPSGLTLEEFFAQPAVVERMTDGRGISSVEIAEALGFDPSRKSSLGQILRHSGRYLGIRLYRRLGDQKMLWMRDGIEPTPNYKKSSKAE